MTELQPGMDFPYAVVSATDEAMLAPAFCSIYSAWLRRSRDFSCILILTDVSAPAREKLVAAAAKVGLPLQLIEHQDDPNPQQDFGRFSQTTMMRLNIDKLLPPGLQRVIYLDADLLVRADMTTLFNMDMQGKCVAAVDDLEAMFTCKAKKLVNRRKQIGMAPDQGYFNSGVMLFDWQQTLRNGLLAKARTLSTKRKFECLDQDILNVVLAGDWLRLDQRWNTVANFPFRDNKSWILHFANARKPWGPNAGHYRKRFADDYRELLAQTPWADFVKSRPSTLHDLWLEACKWTRWARFRITRENVG